MSDDPDDPDLIPETIHFVRSDLVNARMNAPLSGGAAYAAYGIAAALDKALHRRKVDLGAVPSGGIALTIPAASLRPSRGDNTLLRKALRALGRVEWSGVDEGVPYDTRIIAQVRYLDGGRVVEVEIPSMAVKLIAARRFFAMIERDAALYLSGHGARLYGLIANWRNTDKRTDDGWLWHDWEIEHFRQLFGVASSTAYRVFSDLRRRVIAPAVDAINASGVVDLRWRAIREGRSIKHLRFEWRFKSAKRAEETVAETKRHSSARGRRQASAAAPPLVEDEAKPDLPRAAPPLTAEEKRKRLDEMTREIGFDPKG
jgi:hypothetical protein